MSLEPYFHIEDDTYCYPHSSVLRNIPGIRDQAALSAVEADITMLKMTELDAHPVSGSFDTAHLMLIHRRIFEDIYEWAGEFRTVEISKGIPFCYCANIQAQLDSLLGDLRDEDCLRDIADREKEARKLFDGIKDMTDPSIVNTCKLVGFDSYARDAFFDYDPDTVNADREICQNIRIIVDRTAEIGGQ